MEKLLLKIGDVLVCLKYQQLHMVNSLHILKYPQTLKKR